jgi:hypothetical protein
MSGGPGVEGRRAYPTEQSPGRRQPRHWNATLPTARASAAKPRNDRSTHRILKLSPHCRVAKCGLRPEAQMRCWLVRAAKAGVTVPAHREIAQAVGVVRAGAWK